MGTAGLRSRRKLHKSALMLSRLCKDHNCQAVVMLSAHPQMVHELCQVRKPALFAAGVIVETSVCGVPLKLKFVLLPALQTPFCHVCSNLWLLGPKSQESPKPRMRIPGLKLLQSQKHPKPTIYPQMLLSKIQMAPRRRAGRLSELHAPQRAPTRNEEQRVSNSQTKLGVKGLLCNAV